MNKNFDSSAQKCAQQAAQTPEKSLPGLLTYDGITQCLNSFDDHYLDMPRFPEFSKKAKIRAHDSVVIAADTGAGKSSLALNFIHELSEYPALYINLEMDKETVLQRLIAIHSGMELDRIEGYKTDLRTRDKVNTAIKEILAGREIQLLTDMYDFNEIEEQIKAATAGRTRPTLVFVDTALLVRTGSTNTRYERFTKISEAFREIARKYYIVLFMLLQQSREGKKEETQEAPKNWSLKESGSWENDSTKILFLWEKGKEKQKMLSITKNRNGDRGDIKLNYSPHTQEYSEPKRGMYSGKTPSDVEETNDGIPYLL